MAVTTRQESHIAAVHASRASMDPSSLGVMRRRTYVIISYLWMTVSPLVSPLTAAVVSLRAVLARSRASECRVPCCRFHIIHATNHNSLQVTVELWRFSICRYSESPPLCSVFQKSSAVNFCPEGLNDPYYRRL